MRIILNWNSFWKPICQIACPQCTGKDSQSLQCRDENCSPSYFVSLKVLCAALQAATLGEQNFLYFFNLLYFLRVKFVRMVVLLLRNRNFIDSPVSKWSCGLKKCLQVNWKQINSKRCLINKSAIHNLSKFQNTTFSFVYVKILKKHKTQKDFKS